MFLDFEVITYQCSIVLLKRKINRYIDETTFVYIVLPEHSFSSEPSLQSLTESHRFELEKHFESHWNSPSPQIGALNKLTFVRVCSIWDLFILNVESEISLLSPILTFSSASPLDSSSSCVVCISSSAFSVEATPLSGSGVVPPTDSSTASVPSSLSVVALSSELGVLFSAATYFKKILVMK